MKNRRALLLGAIAVATLVVAATAVWWFLLRSTAPPPVSLDEAVAAVTTEPAGSTETAPAADTAGAIDLSGTWSVPTGSGSFAGYRVREELARVGFTTAAGRTEGVTATLEISNGMVSVVEVTVDMSTLRSDESRRDQAIRTQALETAVFPTGSFTLTEPIVLPSSATNGSAFEATAIGSLELHGVTNTVEIALQAQFTDGVIAVVGSSEILFSDYGIDAPVAPILLSVEDVGTMEFQLLFSRG